MIDTKALQKDVEDILVFSQEYPFELNAKELISKWKSAKQQFINLFNGRTIIRSKNVIKIKLSEEQRRERFNEFISTIEETVEITDEFRKFLEENQEGFFDNRVVTPNPKYGINSGSKLSRSFKRFLSELATIRWVQDTASRFMQEDKIEGYLYLSVDPRDFLTISENNSNWWSCHTLDGEYRAGNLSYMVDEVTVVAYLADEEQEHLRCLPSDMIWNNKKWRMLIHTDCENVIYYDRQYPYTSEDLLTNTYLMLMRCLNKTFSTPTGYGFKTIVNQSGEQRLTQTNNIYLENRIFDTRDVIDTSNHLGYCDLVSSSTFTPIMSLSVDLYCSIFVDRKDEGYLKELERARNLYGIKIGGEAPCPCCGQMVVQRDTSFLCPYCIAEHDADEDFFLACDGCGHRIYDEDGIYWKEDKDGNEIAYCKSCYQEMLRDNVIEED